ncbi:MAG TPA: hypothetical protein VK590_10955 [Saprospiraceae bacterium]|nr:hypothetical protein [Saprospiraceae bacterium]
MTTFPRMQSPQRRAGGFTPLALTNLIRGSKPFAEMCLTEGLPFRKHLEPPIDIKTFIKPLKQSFMRNPRLMPGSRVMIAVLAGWGGQGGSIETTMSIIGRNIGRSSRQVFRYLKDAKEEGYLTYSRTKDRMGYYVGIRIWLNFTALFHPKKPMHSKNSIQPEEIRDMTQMSDTKETFKLNDIKDVELKKRLQRFEALCMSASPPFIS